ncbi:MAG: hypothetical protein FJ109_00050 [Deltaproteobacteria bacterium]|nr:hypothetical protein [Deltaproteobacteria bacterium]
MMKTLAKRRWSVLVVLAAALTLTSWLGCDGIDQGALDNEEEVGRQERGRDTGWYWRENDTDSAGNPVWEYHPFYSEVILSPDGLNLLAMVPVPGPDKGYDSPGMILAVQPLPSGQKRLFPEVKDIARLNFSPSGDRAYALAKDLGGLIVVNLRSFVLEKKVDLPALFGVVDVTPDGKYAILSNLPVGDWAEMFYSPDTQTCTPFQLEVSGKAMNHCQFAVVDLATGEVKTHVLPYRLRDIDFSPVGGEVLFTYSYYQETPTLFLPHAVVQFYSPSLNQFVTETDFPNCADELVIDPTRNVALLSPTTCETPTKEEMEQKQHDPISVIDLETRSFVKNLPGFGPVVIASDGSHAVGFTRRDNMVSDWGYTSQNTEIGLIVVDLETLSWKVMDYGNDIPTYTLSPDGKNLFVYAETDNARRPMGDGPEVLDPSEGIIQVKLQDLSWKTIAKSAAIEMTRYVWTEDGSTMYFFSKKGLFRLDAASGKISPIALYGTPTLMNLRPQQDFLVLGEAGEPTFYLLDLANGMEQSYLPVGL